jgi:Holliday junction resolvase RusA-like endonuclease
MAAEAMAGRPPYDGAVILRMCAYRSLTSGMSKKMKVAALAGKIFPTKKPDADNHLKMVEALNKIVWVDDAQIVTALVHKRYSENPRLVIEIKSFVG